MSRTKGSRNKHRRPDFGKKREIYAGKKTKPRRNINGKFVSYISKRKRGDNIKITFWSKTPMSHQGFMNFPNKSRRSMHRYVYGKDRLQFEISPDDISTKEAISELACNYLWAGTWLLMLWSHSKNTYHCSPRCFGIVKIKDSPDGLTCKVIPNYKRRSLRRLWFWRDG